MVEVKKWAQKMGLNEVEVFWDKVTALIIPEGLDEAAPYGLDARPAVPADKFLKNVLPHQVGDFTLVDLKEEQAFVDPYVGAFIVRATYTNDLVP